MFRGLVISALVLSLGAVSAPAEGLQAGLKLSHPGTLKGLAAGMGGLPSIMQKVEADVDAESSYWFNLAMKLGRNPRFRHKIAAAINAKNGYLDRKINNLLLKKEWEVSDIPRLDTVTPNLIRGGEPTEKGFEKLKGMGVTTVVNLRMEDNDEQATVKKLGMTPVWLPIPDTSTPNADQVHALHALLAKPGEKVYIHCSAGIFRTGTMVATWRLANGMTFDATFAEMKAHNYDPEWLLADTEVLFLKDYAAALGNHGGASPAPAPSPAPAH